MKKRELIEQLKYAKDDDDIYIMVSIEKFSDKERQDRLDLDFNESYTKYEITTITRDQFHWTIQIPRIKL